MFFFVFTSQSAGSPFAFDTMLRSAVPPHIGQSPVPGSDATRRTVAAATTKARTTTTQRRKDAKKGGISAFVMLFIGGQFQIVDIRAELGVDEKSRRALSIADRIGLVDLPRRRFGLAGRPRLATRAHLA